MKKNNASLNLVAFAPRVTPLDALNRIMRSCRLPFGKTPKNMQSIDCSQNFEWKTFWNLIKLRILFFLPLFILPSLCSAQSLEEYTLPKFKKVVNFKEVVKKMPRQDYHYPSTKIEFPFSRRVHYAVYWGFELDKMELYMQGEAEEIDESVSGNGFYAVVFHDLGDIGIVILRNSRRDFALDKFDPIFLNAADYHEYFH